MNLEKCKNCSYYGKAVDAPETVENDCMWVPTDGEDIRPCEENE